MTMPTGYDFTRYLDAKRAIDDRALNTRVWSALSAEVGSLRSTVQVSENRRIRILEMGAGTGSMIERLARAGLLVAAEYIAVEASAELVQAGIARIRSWANAQGLHCETSGENHSTMVMRGTVGTQPVDARVTWVRADVFDWLTSKQEHSLFDLPLFDLILAHAFLDLVDAPRLLNLLASVTRPGSLFYFSLNFDGATILLPEYGGGIDDRIEALYHASMNARQEDGQSSGDSRTGRRLFSWMREAAIEIKAAGSSDWVVHAEGGVYPGDAAYFLYHILHFFETSLAGAPGVEAELLHRWLETRRRQIECGELVYVAHQLDLLGIREEREAQASAPLSVMI